MITQEQYDRTTFCKKWAKTPQEAKKKLREGLKRAKDSYSRNPTETNLDDIALLNGQLNEIGA